MTSPEHQLEVVARAYYKLKAMGYKPKLKLLPIGRDVFNLSEEEVHRIRLRVRYSVKKQSLPKGVDDKRWVWPTEREKQAA